MLVTHFLERFQKETGVLHAFSDDALRVMMEYGWPGNVRELEGAIERACSLSSGPVLHVGDLPAELQELRLQSERSRGARSGPASPLRDRRYAGEATGFDMGYPTGLEPEGSRIVSIAEMEKKAILGTIRQLNGDKLMAARLLGIGKTTLYRKLKEYGITEDD
jgi:two-component system response regulator HydG